MMYFIFKKGKAKDVFRELAKMAIADRLLEARYGKRLMPMVTQANNN